MRSGRNRLVLTLSIYVIVTVILGNMGNFPFYIPLILAFIVLSHIGIECKLESKKHREEVK